MVSENSSVDKSWRWQSTRGCGCSFAQGISASWHPTGGAGLQEGWPCKVRTKNFDYSVQWHWKDTEGLPPSCEFYGSVWHNDFSGMLPVHTEGSVGRVIKVLGVYELMVKGLLSPPLSTSAMTYCPLTAIFLINFAHLKASSLNKESTILFKLALEKEVAVQSRGGHDMTV